MNTVESNPEGNLLCKEYARYNHARYVFSKVKRTYLFVCIAI